MGHPTDIKNTVVIIGVGSPFGSDRLGWLAVDRLERGELHKLFPELQLRFDQSDRPGVRLLEQLQGVDNAIILDAMQAGLPPGTLRTFTSEQLGTQTTGLFSSHGFGVAETIALGSSLGKLPQCLTIIGIEAGNEAEAVVTESTATHIHLLIEEILITIQRGSRAE